MALGENIKVWREKKGWTTHQLAEESGTNQSSISRFESNKTRPRPETIKKIAVALGAEVAQLEYGSKNFDVVPIGKRKIPILDHVLAGKWTGGTSLPEDLMNQFTLTNAEYSKDAFATIVPDDSMTPEFREGDLITVDPSIKPRPGDFVLAVEGGEHAIFRRYKSLGKGTGNRPAFELRPLNDVYPTISSELSEIRILGTAVEFTRRFHRR